MGLTNKDKQVYLEGLKKFKERGVDIVVNENITGESAWPLILSESTDDTFFMGDFVVNEGDGSLKEIRFTRCSHNEEGGYNRQPKVE